MKLTISQEGANPITIKTDNGVRSEEKGIARRLAETGLIAGALNKAGLGAGKAAVDNLKNVAKSTVTSGAINTGKIAWDASKNWLTAGKAMADMATNGITKEGLKKLGSSALTDLKSAGQALVDTSGNTLIGRAASRQVINDLSKTGTQHADLTFKGLSAITGAAAKYNSVAQATGKSVGRLMLEDASNVGKAALSAAKANFLPALAIQIVKDALLGTVYNAVTSIGKFESGDEMLKNDKLQEKVDKVKEKYGNMGYPTVEEVSKSNRAKTKSGFLGWLLGGQSSGDKLKHKIKTVSTLLKSVNGVPVSVTKLTPILGTTDVTQIAGLRILIATAYVGKGHKLKSVPLARGYLLRGAKVNASRECADIYWSEDGKAHGKKEIINMIRNIRSNESYSPIDINEAMDIIDELSI